MENYTIILFYKYLPLEDPQKFREEQLEICKKLNLTGRTIIASEGINGTFEGLDQNIKEYVKILKKDPKFSDVHIKYSKGDGKAFPKLSIKVRGELVAGRLGEVDVKPWEVTGKYIFAEDLHEWIKSGKKFYIVDMRNEIEQEVGLFTGSIPAQMYTFADLPKVLPKLAKIKKDDPIVTVCTGGVRCEKASGFLIKHGFSNVYQLYGGIVTYMEKYPGEDFLGSLYVFDSRMIMAFNMDDPNREIIGKCIKCQKKTEKIVNCKDSYCNRQFLICAKCLNEQEKVLCPIGCRDYSLEHPELFIKLV